MILFAHSFETVLHKGEYPMPSALAYETLADKSGLLTVTDPKFKRNRLSVNLIVPMQTEHLDRKSVV